jgi:threonine dehydrogenase-like Zn-dependent dehydrogenase
MGADAVLNPESDDVAEAVRARTDGRGADLAFEVVGISPSLNIALECLRKGGSLTMVGNVTPRVEFPMQDVVTRELTIYGTCASRGEYGACLDMIARGGIDVDRLISAVVPLAEGAAWFERLYNRQPGLFKVVLTP